MNTVSILRFLLAGNKTIFEVTKEEQCRFLDRLGDEGDNISRSYKQYLGRNFFAPRWKVIFLNFISFFAFPFLLVSYLIKGNFSKPFIKKTALSSMKGIEEVMPEELKCRYDIDYNSWILNGSLTIGDLSFISKLYTRSFPSCYFALKALTKVAQYSELIRCHAPEAIIVANEYSFSSSLLTEYCHHHHVLHIDVMHGEKLFNVRDSYFRFDQCYVWNEFYRELFVSLRAYPEQFKIHTPISLVIDVNKYYRQDDYADYKYYLASFTEKEIQDIVLSMKVFKNRGKSVKYRLHPRYMGYELISKYVEPGEIENPIEVPILTSVASCSTTVGSYSTVLSQAYHSGKKVILDDVTYKSQFDKLKDLDYWLSVVGCNKLSDYQKNGN